VELAASLPALMLLVFVALSMVAAVRTEVRCVDAAREAARVEARGGPGLAAGQRVAPTGAVVMVGADDGTVRSTVSVRFNPLGGRLPGFTITASAVAAMEPEASE
jgi:Flp pilus assembly pilin Flp